MDATVFAGILGAIATVVSAVVTAYRDEIKNVLLRTKDLDYLEGHWQCSWDITSLPAVVPAHIEDQVRITKVNGRLVKGEASTPGYGKWQLEGKATQFVVTFSYSGENTMKDAVGVVIVKKDSPTKLNGVWCQYTPSGNLRSGTTVWDKIQ